jgi:transposase
MPSRRPFDDEESEQMAAVVIGVDPAKGSHTIEVIDGRETVLATGRFENNNVGYRATRVLAKRWPDRVWAVEGASGVGRHLAQRLLSDGERVLDVPSKLSTRVRAMDTGHGRKNDPADAHAVAVVGLRTTGLREVSVDDQMVALRLLSARRRDLVRSRTQAVNRLHQALMELIPAGAPRGLTAGRAKELLATIRPRDIAGRTRRQVSVDLVDDVMVLDRKLTAIESRIKEAVAATGTTLTDIVGVGPITAAVILGEVGDIARFASSDAFASYTGTAPLEVSSGDVKRHRLSRAGNRRLNSALHIIALAHKRHDPRGKAYYAKKLSAGKGTKGAMRCLKRRLSDVVFRRLVDEQALRNPGGQMGATLTSSAADLIPMANTSEKPQPGLNTDHTPLSLAAS